MIAYQLHGLSVRSEISLPAPTLDGTERAEWELSLTERRAIPRTAPTGRLIARAGSQARGYAAARAESLVIRVFGVVDFVVTSGRIETTADPAADIELVGLLFAGTVASLILLERGHLALHASAVATPRGSLALLGSSGAGKSTLAGLACAGGYQLVTDDLLRVDLSPDGVVAYPGTTQLRLRETASSVAEAIHPHPAERSSDGRLVVPRHSATRPSPLLGLMFPRPLHDAATSTTHQLSGSEALHALLSASRAEGVVEPQLLGLQLRLMAELARRVPIARVDLPWGPPFQSDLASKLVGSILGKAAPGALSESRA